MSPQEAQVQFTILLFQKRWTPKQDRDQLQRLAGLMLHSCHLDVTVLTGFKLVNIVHIKVQVLTTTTKFSYKAWAEQSTWKSNRHERLISECIYCTVVFFNPYMTNSANIQLSLVVCWLDHKFTRCSCETLCSLPSVTHDMNVSLHMLRCCWFLFAFPCVNEAESAAEVSLLVENCWWCGCTGTVQNQPLLCIQSVTTNGNNRSYVKLLPHRTSSTKFSPSYKRKQLLTPQ